MEKKIWYLCDPEKAKECKKNMCSSNKNATYPVCDRTSHREWAALDKDGKPILNEPGELTDSI